MSETVTLPNGSILEWRRVSRRAALSREFIRDCYQIIDGDVDSYLIDSCRIREKVHDFHGACYHVPPTSEDDRLKINRYVVSYRILVSPEDLPEGVDWDE